MLKASISWNTKQVIRMYDNGTLRFDNAIQRGEVWDNYRKSLLVDSILRDFPVPPMYTIKTDVEIKTLRGKSKVYDCLDGKQRCTAIAQFKNNAFKLIGLEPFELVDGEIDINGLTYSELPEEMQDVFDSFSLLIYYIVETNDDEIKQMMDRLNNGKVMTSVEKSRIKAVDLNGIKELAEHKLFKETLSVAAINRYNNEDIVIKNYIQYVSPDDPNFDNKRIKDVYVNHVFSDEEKTRFTRIFDKTYEIIGFIKDSASKKVYKKSIKKNNLLAILSIAEMDIPSEMLAKDIEIFFTTIDSSVSISPEYNEASKHGTNHSKNVIIRNNAIKENVLKKEE